MPYGKLGRLTPEGEALFNKNVKLARWFARQFARTYHTLDHDELYSAGLIGLMRAAGTFDPSIHTCFSAHATYCMRSAAASEHQTVARHRRHNFVPELGMTQFAFPSPDEDETEELRQAIRDAIRDFSGKKRTIVELYVAGYTAHDIAKQAQCSQSYVSLVARTTFAKLGLVGRIPPRIPKQEWSRREFTQYDHQPGGLPDPLRAGLEPQGDPQPPSAPCARP